MSKRSGNWPIPTLACPLLVYARDANPNARFLFRFGQHSELITVTRRFIQCLLCATRRDARGAPVLLLTQAVAFGLCFPVCCLLFLLLLPDGAS